MNIFLYVVLAIYFIIDILYTRSQKKELDYFVNKSIELEKKLKEYEG